MALPDTLSALSTGYQTVLGGGTYTFGGVAYTSANLGALRLVIARHKLAAADDAIDAILLGAQSYSVEGRTFTKANLDALRAYKSELSREIASRSGGRPLVANIHFGSEG